MPLVYIHGVRHREPEKLEVMKAKLEAVLRDIRPPLAQRLDVRIPYWGKFGASLSIGGLLPLDAPVLESVTTFEALAEPPDPIELVREAARDDDVQMRQLLEEALRDEQLSAEDLLELRTLLAGDWQAEYQKARVQVAMDRKAALQAPAAAITLERARPVSPAPEASTPRDLVWNRGIGLKLVDLVERSASKLAFDNTAARTWVRAVQHNCALFFADAMAYVIQRESQGEQSPILNAILEALPPEGESSEPLIVVTHSMGAAILYDVLTAFRPDLYVDCLISVGSQVGQFASLGLLAKQPGSGVQDLSKRVGAWFNIFDRLDFLNFLAHPAFSNARDIEYANARGPLVSHSWYFKEAKFWKLVQKLIGEGLATSAGTKANVASVSP
jgi:hypothetical protein